MYHDDGHQLYLPQDVRLCSVCRNWVELSEFRKRTGGGIAPECRECHNSIRAAQRRRQRARRRTKDLQQAVADINVALPIHQTSMRPLQPSWASVVASVASLATMRHSSMPPRPVPK